MFSSTFPLLISLLLVGSTSASLYPTQPIETTVFHGGAFNNITWLDNDAAPGLPISQLGRLQIDLWESDIKRVATLATDVDPQAMSQVVYINPNAGENASNYVVRFKSLVPPKTIYTSDFTITNMTGNRNANMLRQSLSNSDALSSSTTTSSSAPDGGFNDLVTVTKEMVDSSTASPPNPTSVGAVGAMANGASNGGRHVRRPSMRFNFVFVLFPALFGLALAL